MRWEDALKSRRSKPQTPSNHTQKQLKSEAIWEDEELLAAAVAFKIIEQLTVKEVWTAWSALTDREKIAVPASAFVDIKAMPTGNAIQLKCWRDKWLDLIRRAQHAVKVMENNGGSNV